jgi:sugar phosphate isomerase/epimerase
MDARHLLVPARSYGLGTTSYIYPTEDDNLLANVERLCWRFDKIQLLAFGRHYLNQLLGPRQLQGLAQLQAESAIEYSLHLPLDLGLLQDDTRAQVAAIDVIADIVERVQGLQVSNYIVHLDPFTEFKYWPVELNQATLATMDRALELLCRRFGPMSEQFCLENTAYDLLPCQQVVNAHPVSLCVDFGHAWLAGHDVEALLACYGQRIREVHVHGIKDGKDHRGLDCLSPSQGKQLGTFLANYKHSVIIEVFNNEDLEASLGVLEAMSRQHEGKSNYGNN